MVLTASFVLSPVTGLFCHRHPADYSAKLDTSVGASGPHDFSVRVSAVRPWRHPRPPHPAPNVYDDRETPLRGNGTAGDIEVIWVNREAEYFCRGGWTGFGDLPDGSNEQAECSSQRADFHPSLQHATGYDALEAQDGSLDL
jgi:hypothetical protein